MAKRKRVVETCPYDGTRLPYGEACPKCEADITDHLRRCYRCAGDYADMRARDARHGE